MNGAPSPEVMAALPYDLRPSHRDLLAALGDPRLAGAPPALHTAATAVLRVTVARLDRVGEPDAVATMVEATTAALAAGGDVPADLADQLDAITAAAARAQSHEAVLRQVAINLGARFAAAAMSQADAMLAGALRTHLGEIMARHAALVAAAGGRDFADAAAFVGAGAAAAEAWFALDDLALDYAWLREVHTTVLDGATTRDDALAAAIGAGWHEVRHVGGYDDWPTEARARFLRALASTPVVRTQGEMGAAMRGRPADPAPRQVQKITVVHHPPEPRRRPAAA